MLSQICEEYFIQDRETRVMLKTCEKRANTSLISYYGDTTTVHLAHRQQRFPDLLPAMALTFL